MLSLCIIAILMKQIKVKKLNDMVKSEESVTAFYSLPAMMITISPFTPFSLK